MEPSRLRVALDANVLIAGVLLPRWPYEVLRAALDGYYDLVLPRQVVEEAARHLEHPTQAIALQLFFQRSGCQLLEMPDPDLVRQELDLVRSERDVPIALALLHAGVDIFVTNDRDFTDPGGAAERFHATVRVMLPAVFLREVLGWSSDALEAVRNRLWGDLVEPEPEDPDG